MPAGQDLTIQRRSAKGYVLWAGLLPIHVPKVFTDSNGDLGYGLPMVYHPLVRMGSDRLGFVGTQQFWYAGDSYVRGGGPAEGFTWSITKLTDSNHPGSRTDEFVDFASSEAFDPDPAAPDKAILWTPASPGIYQVRCDAAGGLSSGYPASVETCGVRYVNVLASEADNILPGLVSLSGPQGDLQSGNCAMQVTYQLPDEVISARQIFSDNMRFVVYYKTFYQDPETGEYEDFTWGPGRATVPYVYYQPNILFSGLIRGSSIEEAFDSRTVSFTVEGALTKLAQTEIPTVTKYVKQARGRPTEILPTFVDEELYVRKIAPNAKAVEAGWYLRQDALNFSDAIYYTVQSLTNVAMFSDIGLWQADTDTAPGIEIQGGSLAQFFKSIMDKRFGVMWASRHGEIFLGPILNLRGDDHWATAGFEFDFELDESLILSLSATRQVPNVGQVYVSSIPIQSVIGSVLEPRPGESRQDIVFEKFYEGVWPARRGPGTRVQQTATMLYSNAACRQMAAKFRRHLNAEYPSVTARLDMFGGLDLNQSGLVTFSSLTEQIDWVAKPFHVAGYGHSIQADGSEWETTLTLAEITDARAAGVEANPPEARMQVQVHRETILNGEIDESVWTVIMTDRSIEGDEPLTTVTWIGTDSLGTPYSATGRRAVFHVPAAAAGIQIQLNIIDASTPIALGGTATKSVIFANIPDVLDQAHEAVWVAAADGAYVTPDAGRSWNFSTTPVGATCIWAQNDGRLAFCGTQSGSLYASRDGGVGWQVVSGTNGSRVTAVWGHERPQGCYYGTEDGRLWEVALDPITGVFKLAEAVGFRTRHGATAAITYVQDMGSICFVARGTELFAGLHNDWVKLANFPRIISQGRATGGYGDDTSQAAEGYKFYISLVFMGGGWEMGRVAAGKKGLTWATFTLDPAVGGAGSDTTITRMDGASDTGVLATFMDSLSTYLLDNPADLAVGPGVIPAAPADTRVPAPPAQAIEVGLEGRDLAFLGDQAGVWKNIDPFDKASGLNLWMPFKPTGGDVRRIYVTRPFEIERSAGANYIFIHDGASTAGTALMVLAWSPHSDPPQYVIVDYFDYDPGNPTRLNISNTSHPIANRIRGRTTTRVRGGAAGSLPPGFSSVTQFAIIKYDTSFEWHTLSANDAALVFYYGGAPIGSGVSSVGQGDGYYGGGHFLGGYYGRGGNVWKAGASGIVGQLGWGWARDVHLEVGAWGQWPRHYDRAYYGFRPDFMGGRSGPPPGDPRAMGFALNASVRDHDGTGLQRILSHLDPVTATTYSPGTYLLQATLNDTGDLLWDLDSLWAKRAGWAGPSPSWAGARWLSPYYLDNAPGMDPEQLFYIPPGESVSWSSRQEVLFGGAPCPGVDIESFDTYWAVSNDGRLWYRTGEASFAHVIPTTNPETEEAWDGAWGFAGPITANADPSGCTAVVTGGDTPLIIQVFSDGSWLNRTGNLYEPILGEEENAPAILLTHRPTPIALRHVLPSEVS